MSTVENNYKFAPSHEWVKNNNDGTVTIGISHHAQDLLGDVVFVELPEVGDEITAGENFSLVESVKAASDIYAPLSGEVIEVNDNLDDSPELINESPFVDGWIAKVKVADPTQIESLLSYDAYNMSIEE